MRRIFLLLCAVVWGVAYGGERVALVVGCGTYSNMPGRQLVSPSADSEDVAGALKQMGYRLIGGGAMKELSREKLTEAVEALTNAAKGAEAAVFYFSGHGVQIGDENYLLPVDMPKITGMAQMKGRAVNLRESVMVGLEESGVETKVVVLDCCRDNPFSTQLEAAMAAVGKSVRTKGVGEMSGYGSGFYLAFATSPGREALDGNGKRNSPFTGAFLKSLPSAGVEDIDLFFREVKKQMPKDQVSWTNNSLEKEFYLNRDSSALRKTASVNEPSAPSAPPAPTPETSTSVLVEPKMVLVKGGHLPLGSKLAGQEVKDFQIGKYEVTWGEWKAVREWAVTRGYDLGDVGEGDSNGHPVTSVSWYHAVKWCNARSEKEGKTPVYLVGGAVYRRGDSVPTVDGNANGYRLPLEAEWEWAARGGVSSLGYTYSGSNTLDDVAWYFTNSGAATSVVGTKAGNELGIYDMSGNVREWCWDAHRGLRQLRGGSRLSRAISCTVVFGGYGIPTYGGDVDGFRVARITAYGVAESVATEGNVTIPREVQGASAKPRLSPPNGGMVSVRGGTLPEASQLAGQVVGDFQIGKYEVTWVEWKAVRDWSADKGYDLAGVGGTYPENGGDNLPVVNVSWYDVVKWCNARSEKEGKTAVYEANGGVYRSGEFRSGGSSSVTMKSGANGYRLPLEKEWEWAARGGCSSKGYAYSGGNVVGEVAWIDENSGRSPKAVGGRNANELGIYDMSGNLWEWCWDADGALRRGRGGSWSDPGACCAVAYRNVSAWTDSRNIGSGFRVALSSAR